MSNKAREWVKLSTSVITDDAFLDLSAAAKVAYLLGLAKAGNDRSDGLVPVQPRSMVRWTGLDSSDAATAVAELTAAGFWTIEGEFAHVRNWASYQPTNEEMDAKRRQAVERQQKSREKKRTEKATAAAESGELDAAGVRSNLWTAMNRAVRDEMDQETAVAVYRKLYEQAVTAGSEGGRYAAVKGVGPAMLANVVINHAALRWLGMEPDAPELRRLHALRKDHGAAVLDALPLAAAGAKGDPIAYLTSILRKGVAR
jgi:hypothetical protein